MSKHAYLILAHNNWNILNKCLSLLDNKENDIFIHIDKRVKTFEADKLYKCEYSNVKIIERINVYWADFSVVEAYLNLLQSAFEYEREQGVGYSYFHLQSGVCLPLKPQSYIHDFCDNSGKEFIGIVPQEFRYCTVRTQYYWPFTNTSSFRRFKALKALCYGWVYAQKGLGLNRLRHSDYSIYNGWCNSSVSHDLAKYLLDNRTLIFNMFHSTLCPDELWIQTLAYNSHFKDKIYDANDLRNGSMRFIDWQRGKPYTWGRDKNDLRMLLDSPYLFARKFRRKSQYAHRK